MFRKKLDLNNIPLRTRLASKKKISDSKIKKQQKLTSGMIINSSLTWKISAFIMKSVILLFFGSLILFPFYYMIATSLMNVNETRDMLHIHLVPKSPQWSNFGEALISGYWKAIMLTSIVTSASIILKIVITMLMGYAFSLKNWRGKQIIWYFFLALLMIPEVALMLGQYKALVTMGWHTGVKVAFGLIAPFVASVFSGFMFRNAFEKIPARTKEAAMVDGASSFSYFIKVAVPMVTPTIWTVGILTAFAAWNSYVWPSLLLQGSDQHVINTWLFQTGKDPLGQDTRIMNNVRMAGAILAIVPMFGAYFLMRGRIMRAISRQGSAIKG